jgi:hypothetical protein
MNPRLLFALAVALVAGTAHHRPAATVATHPTAMSMMVSAGWGAFALRLCAGSTACR